jgi:hypothetical protein
MFGGNSVAGGGDANSGNGGAMSIEMCDQLNCTGLRSVSNGIFVGLYHYPTIL